MTYRRSPARFAQAAVLTMLVFVALPAAAAQATIVPTKHVSIVPASTTCKSISCFKPSSLTVTPGTKVVWSNMAIYYSHTVTRCTIVACGKSGGTGKDKGLSSPILAYGAKYSFTFHGAGTYLYYCKIHGFKAMHAIVTVS